MNKTQRALLAGTILSGLVCVEANIADASPAPNSGLATLNESGFVLAQAPEPDAAEKKKSGSKIPIK